MIVPANVVALGAIPLWARLSDRIGRRPVFALGALGSAVAIFLFLWAVSGQLPADLRLRVLLSGVVYSAANGVWPSLYGEMFGRRCATSAWRSARRSASRWAASRPRSRPRSPVSAERLAAGRLDRGRRHGGGLCALTARETAHLPLAELNVPATRADARQFADA